ncbi:MAG: nucleoside-diphosphate kinase [Patescibacteria group bacterium]
MLEKTLVLIKPDGVKRGLMGRILCRFEDAGLKIVAMKLRQSDEAHALKHYTEDIEKRRGKKVRELLVDFLKSGPVLAFVVEGVNAIENVRKIVGATEPKAALPGTIRGDFAHVSFGYADEKGKVVENLIHASSDAADAEREVWLWFNEDEICEYKSAHEAHTL